MKARAGGEPLAGISMNPHTRKTTSATGLEDPPAEKPPSGRKGALGTNATPFRVPIAVRWANTRTAPLLHAADYSAQNRILLRKNLRDACPKKRNDPPRAF